MEFCAAAIAIVVCKLAWNVWQIWPKFKGLEVLPAERLGLPSRRNCDVCSHLVARRNYLVGRQSYFFTAVAASFA